MRLDQLLVQLGKADSRTKAQDLVRAGQVQIKEPSKGGGEFRTIKKPSYDVTSVEDIEIVVGTIAEHEFVSRAGTKLKGALEHCQFSVDGLLAMDMGQSTGGFSQCLVDAGATHVVGIEVGHDQLHESLLSHEKIECHQGVNGRDTQAVLKVLEGRNPDLVVMDVSFVSMTQLLETLYRVLPEGGHLLSLVKPQFELGRDKLNRAGVVRDRKEYDSLRVHITESVEAAGFSVKDYFASSIQGKDGNSEFFIFAQK